MKIKPEINGITFSADSEGEYICRIRMWGPSYQRTYMVDIGITPEAAAAGDGWHPVVKEAFNGLLAAAVADEAEIKRMDL